MADEERSSLVPQFFFWIGVVLCSLAIYRLWPVRGYYLLSPAMRPIHSHHEFLRSSGKGGLTFGAVATLLIFVNLTYLLRKQLISWSWLGSLRSWMAFHIFTGLVAGFLVLLHSGFLMRSALGSLALGSIIVVVITGIIGRYIYAHTPRSLKGKELELDELRSLLGSQQSRLVKLGMPRELFETSVDAPLTHQGDKGILSILFSLVAGDRQLHNEQQKFHHLVLGRADLKVLAHEILPMADRYCQARMWLARYQELRSLMSGWRFLHRWMAIVLLSAVSFHIFIAFQMGNLWLADTLRSAFHSFHP